MSKNRAGTSKKSKNSPSQSKYPDVKELLLPEPPNSVFPYLNGPKLQRKKYFLVMNNALEQKSIKRKVQPVTEFIEDAPEPREIIFQQANLLPSTCNTKYIDRDILKRIAVPKLQEDLKDVLLEIMKEVRQEFVNVTHQVGIICIVKPSQLSEGHITLKPYQLPGKTDFHKTRLKIIKKLETRLFITFPLIRGILNFCVEDLPDCLINFSIYRDKTRDINELRQIFSEEIKKGKFLIQSWYQNVLIFVKNDQTQIDSVLEPNYFSCGTGLMSVYLSQALRSTIKQLIEVTSQREKIPYLQMNLCYRKKILLEPSLSQICNLYVQLVDKISSMADDLPALEAFRCNRCNNKLIPIFISAKKQEMYKKQIEKNILTLFTPVIKHVKELNEEFSALHTDQENYTKLDNVSTSINITVPEPENAICDLEYPPENEEPIEQYMDLDKDITFEEGYKKVDFYRSFKNKLALVVDIEYYLIGQLEQSSCKNAINTTLITTINKISEKLISQHIWENEDICEQFETLALRANTIPDTSDELVELQAYVSAGSTELLPILKSRIEESVKVVSKLVETTELSASHIHLNCQTVYWLDEIKPVLEQHSIMIEARKFELEEHLQKCLETLNSNIKEFYPRLDILDEMDDADYARQYLNTLTELLVIIRNFDKDLEWINKEEITFKFPLTAIPELKEVTSHVYNFHRVVKVCCDWNKSHGAWTTNHLKFLDHAKAESEIQKYSKELEKAQKIYRNQIRQAITEGLRLKFKGLVDDPDPANHPAPIKLCSKTLNAIKNFKPSLHMMKIMCNDALLQRHWDEMSEIAEFDMTPDSGTTLNKLMTMGLEKDVDKYEIISTGALKERQLLQNLTKMQEEWDDILFKTSLYKDTDISILVHLEDIQVILDDHLIKTLSMRGSVFVKPYEAEVKDWYEKIVRMNATLEEWNKVQSQRLYLLPIFSSEDIVKQMPEEGRLFKEVDKIQCRYMNMIEQDPRVTETAGSKEILEDLQNCIKLLERINEGAMAYLERKRLLFPRFFFLSNAEMLEILSETKNPLHVQQHLNKCFVGINKLDFDDKLRIRGMFNEENERVELVSAIGTEEARGAVEKWLIQLEDQMKVSVHNEILRCLADYNAGNQKQWIEVWSGQVILVAKQIFWASDVTNMLETGNLDGLKVNLKNIETTLDTMINLINDKKTSNTLKVKIRALIIIKMHNKEVTQKLIKEKVSSDKDFIWLMQLRYYWKDQCIVRLINTTFKYAYEYLRNCSRLVITPLTERCYRTLIGAYEVHLNGAAEGPTGTGKTETFKDLANALAVYHIVFNCTSQLDYKIVGKFIKGLAASGAWVCFDEFDKISIKVLSVIAQQIFCLTSALKSDTNKLMLEGVEISINTTCFIYATLNPGYIKRLQLPENLKILFRPVSMMVPDYNTIVEISLYSYGIKSAKGWASKIVTLHQLFWEQLSRQNHYEFGLRMIKSMLLAFNNNKFRFPDENEEALLLKSIVNLNLPKLIKDDITLFKNILLDLFPSVAHPINYEVYHEKISTHCKNRSIQPTNYVKTKIMETYEMMLIRPGLMLVGGPFSGKTTILNVLSQVICTADGEKVHCQFINPKSLSIEQLYGQFNPITYEWYDGIVATYFRQFAADVTKDRKWLVFDGPIDIIWAENLNTVLDDTRKFCLTSGEVIKFTSTMSIIFETMNLTHTSPTTVSRCGVIYLEPKALGWKPHADSWIDTCNKEWSDSNEQLVMDLLSWLVPPSLTFIRNYCYQVCEPGEINLVKSMLQIVNAVLTDACNDSTKKEEDFKNMHSWIQAAFVYGGLWGLGATLDQPSREKLDDFFRKIWKAQDKENPYPGSMEKLEITIPADGLLFDYTYMFKGRGSWKNWAEVTKTMKIDEATNIYQVLIPTADTVKNMSLVEMRLKSKVPVLLVGPAGTGKSLCMHDFLMNKLDHHFYEPDFATLTVKISANQTQEIILSKLNKYKRGHYGPSKGKTCTILLDDLNMPEREAYGAQPPLELLRQYLDYGRWYDFKDNSDLHLHDVLLTATMSPRGEDGETVSSRFLRHFHILSISDVSHESTSKIYTNILLLGFKNNGFPADVAIHVQQIVSATLEVYGEIVQMLKPTPSKSHYIFNLRDFSKIIFGCAMLRKESADNKVIFAKLWVHEVLRVVYDRLTNATEKTWLYKKIRSAFEEYFKENFDSVFGNLNEDEEREINEEELHNLMFNMYLDRDAAEQEKKYEEITNTETFYNLAINFMKEYNCEHKHKLDIVLFKRALEDLNKICRVLSMPCGNALLVGINGSGRQSLVKLATVIAGHYFLKPNITKSYGISEWREDIKTLIKEAGGYGKQTVFVVSEEDILDEEFLQSIDCLLNSGEIPNIFQIDEKQEILEMARLAAQGGNRNVDVSALTVMSFFIKRTKENLHIILCFSPRGSTLRKKICVYPSLVNCCVINWFEDWSQDGLEKIARKWISNVNLTIDIKKLLISAFKHFHATAQSLSNTYFAKTSFRMYVTSASYLEMIKNFAHLMINRQKEILAIKSRYVAGLQKLEFAAAQIAEMQKALEDYKPQLEEMTEKAAQMTKEIAIETIQVENTSALVRRDEEIANAQAAEAQRLKSECEADLAEAIPILEDAIAALNTLKPTDITLVKSMKNPPDAIKLVMAAVCVMKDVKPDRLPDPSTGRKIIDYWGPSKRILGDMNFLQSLKDFDKDHIKPEIMVKIRKEYIPHKDFKPHVVMKASSAAEGLCKWVIAMDMYDKVAKEVAPKKEKLEKAEREYAATMAILLEKKEQLARLEKRLADLNIYLAEATEKQHDLQRRVDLCERKLERAEKLIGGLGGEKSRWVTIAENLQNRYDYLAGDILISAAMVAYLASFNAEWRFKITDEWVEYVRKLQIPVSTTYNFIETLGDKIKIHDWHTADLPQNQFSVESAIILKSSKKWCLLIDSELQANMWIKKMEKENNLHTVKFSDDDYMDVLLNCISSGNPVLIENVGKMFSPAINPLLLGHTFIEDDKSFIILNNTTIPYNLNFRLYLTSNLRNPHYLPNIYNKVTIVNFSLTESSLEEKLLDIVVGKERPDLQEERDNLVLQSSANKKALAEVETMILKTLSDAKGDILEDETSIQTLDRSKLVAANILQRQTATKEAKKNIEHLRFNYKPVAKQSSNLYDCVSSLRQVNLTYEFSLKWFLDLYTSSIRTSKTSRFLDKRLLYLTEGFTYNLYVNVCQSLFEKDVVLFSFLLCLRVKSAEIEEERTFFLNDITSENIFSVDQSIQWLPAKVWTQICQLDKLTPFSGIQNSFISSTDAWKSFYDHPKPHNTNLPTPWNGNCTPFQKLLIIKTLRPDKIKSAISKYVEEEMGVEYTIAPQFDISKSFEQSNCICPLVFILSPDTNPVSMLSKFAKLKGYAYKLHCVSLGERQKSMAEDLIKQGQLQGTWVCLQNCHLAGPWIISLAKLCENLNTSNTHPQFRLWLTTSVWKHFPISILQNSVKMVNDAPKTFQQSLLRSYLSEPLNNPDYYKSCPGNERMFAKMLYGVTFFHAVVKERLRFGPIGWNIPYEFNESDFNISIQQLQTFVNEYSDNPYEGIRYLLSECNYRGRIQNEWDRRLIKTLLSDFVNPNLVNDMNFSFSSTGDCYNLPRKAEYDVYLAHVETLPKTHPPEVFGLHVNTLLTRDLKESSYLLNSIQLVQNENNLKTNETDIFQVSIIEDILLKLPKKFDLSAAKHKYLFNYNDSTNTVVIQEMERFNKLLQKMRNSLDAVQKAIKGLMTMTDKLELLYYSIVLDEIPASWAKYSYPSLKSLSSYLADFVERLTVLQKWFDHEKPPTFWLAGFYSPEAFLAAIKQNYGRKYNISTDQLTFDFEVLKVFNSDQSAEDGAYTYGLFIEGASWDIKKGILCELPPKIMHHSMPLIWLKLTTKSQFRLYGRYVCPLYRTSERRDVLSTTGHSNNYVLPFYLDTEIDSSHWIKRGVALLCQLD